MVTDPVPVGDWLIIAPIIVTIVMGSVLVMLRKNTRIQPRIAGLGFALLVVLNIGLLARVLSIGPLTMTMGRWLPPFGISFTVDVLGASFALAASIVAFFGAIYGAADVDATGRRYGFYPFLFLLMTGVFGAFLTGDMFNLYVWFEVLLISSFGMIVLGSEKEQIDGGFKYAVLNLVATTLFLVAIGYLYGLFGTLNMADLVGKVRALEDTRPLAVIGALFAFAFAMKAAAFPVHFWLPASYHTPRIVVSAVFAGILTKVGVYALIRVLTLLMPAIRVELSDILAWAAIATMLVGVIGALAQSDVRRLFGYLVISGIGSMMAGLALGTYWGLAGAVMYALHSMIVMTALYLALGIAMRYCNGAARLQDLGGLYRASPFLAVMFLILAFAIAGLPPFTGFWPKVVLVDASFSAGRTWLGATILATGFLTSIAIGRVWVHAFWRGGPLGTADGTDATPAPAADVDGETHQALMIPLAGLTLLVVVFGIWAEPIARLGDLAAAGLLDPAAYVRSVFGEAP